MSSGPGLSQMPVPGVMTVFGEDRRDRKVKSRRRKTGMIEVEACRPLPFSTALIVSGGCAIVVFGSELGSCAGRVFSLKTARDR